VLESEVIRVVRQVNAYWQNAKPIPPEALPLWLEDLSEFPAEEIQTAFRMYRRRGAQFPPTCAELRRLVLELRNPTPTFEAAWGAIRRAIDIHGRYRVDEALGDLAGVSLALPLVEAMGGWQAICNGGPNEDLPTNPGVWRSQGEHAFRALVESQRDDRAMGSGLPELPPIAELEILPRDEPSDDRGGEATA
jgi:hypothetical protein